MAKYYVESGNFHVVIESTSSFNACVKAVRTAIDTGVKNSIDLDATFLVNETGFPSERETFVINSCDEKVYDIETVFEALN